MKVKELIGLLKRHGIKGNAEITIESISDSLVRGAVVFIKDDKQKVILTDLPGETKDYLAEQGIKEVKEISLW